MSDKSINAANAGGGEFYVTRGLLDRATDEQLLAIMAHEFAHNDLGHVAKAQRVQAGVELGAAILEQVIPTSAIVTPIAGTLITRAHSRSEELEADRHAVTLLRRVGSSKQSAPEHARLAGEHARAAETAAAGSPHTPAPTTGSRRSVSCRDAGLTESRSVSRLPGPRSGGPSA